MCSICCGWVVLLVGSMAEPQFLGPPLGGLFTLLFDPCSYLHVTWAKDAASLARRWNFLAVHHFRMMSPATICHFQFIYHFWNSVHVKPSQNFRSSRVAFEFILVRNEVKFLFVSVIYLEFSSSFFNLRSVVFLLSCLRLVVINALVYYSIESSRCGFFFFGFFSLCRCLENCLLLWDGMSSSPKNNLNWVVERWEIVVAVVQLDEHQ